MSHPTFSAPPTPWNERERLASIHQLRILEEHRDENLDRLTRTATRIMGAPYSLLSIVASDTQHFKSTCGIDLKSTSREVSFCAHTILQDEPMVVLDATRDDRFAGNPLVLGEPGIRYYVGAPLRTAGGLNLGSLCVFDKIPRPYPTKSQLVGLKDLAELVIAQFESQDLKIRMAEQEESLRASERRAALALDAGQMGAWSVNLNTGQGHASARVGAILGVTLARDTELQQWWDRIHPDDRALLREKLNDSSSGSFRSRYRIIRPDGEIRWIASYGAYECSAGGERLASGVCLDVTAEEASARAIRESEERFRQLCVSGPIGVWSLDRQLITRYVNPKLLEIWGLAEAQFVAGHSIPLLHPDDRSLLEGTWIRLRETKEVQTAEFRIIRTDGQVRWLRVFGASLSGPEGDFQGAIASVLDITEERNTMKYLEAAREYAEKASRSKDLFLANVSHELRTPLNGILTSTELLKLSPLTSEAAELVQVIRDSGQSLLAVVNDILDLRRVENGTVAIESLSFSLPGVLEQAVAQVEVSARYKGFAIETQYPADLPAQWIGDPGRIRQILHNFLSNAVKFSSVGPITIRVEREGRSFDKDQLRISVRDHGIGIAPEARGLLFQPFSQLDSSRSRRHGGIGLGLAICKNLAELMGGSVGMESEPGKGSCFFLRLPLQCSKSLPATPARTGIRASTKAVRRTVLLAEDNPINQKVAVRLLEKLGWEVHLAQNGRQAREMAEQRRYSLILMDCQMPELDGYSATESIRAWEAREHRTRTPIVALTAHAMTGDRDRCLQAGMDDYLSKPFQVAELQDMLHKWAAADSELEAG